MRAAGEDDPLCEWQLCVLLQAAASAGPLRGRPEMSRYGTRVGGGQRRPLRRRARRVRGRVRRRRLRGHASLSTGGAGCHGRDLAQPRATSAHLSPGGSLLRGCLRACLRAGAGAAGPAAALPPPDLAGGLSERRPSSLSLSLPPQAFERHLASDLASPGRGQARHDPRRGTVSEGASTTRPRHAPQARPALTAVMNAFARRGDLATLAALQRRADEAGVPLYTERVNAMLLGCREVGDAAEAVRQYEAGQGGFGLDMCMCMSPTRPRHAPARPAARRAGRCRIRPRAKPLLARLVAGGRRAGLPPH